MPKRSNEFQRLIHYLYSELVPKGFTVTESAMVREAHSGIEREIDILLEQVIAGTPIRIAIECRDRTRKDNIEWIDSLDGKFQKEDISKIIAVSNSGFTKGALAKAKSLGIETKTFEEVKETDWPSEFIKFGIAKTNTTISILSFSLNLNPPLKEKIQPNFVIVLGENKHGTLEDVLNHFYDTLVYPATGDFLQKNFCSIYKTMADFEKDHTNEYQVIPEDLSLIDTKGIQHIIDDIKYKVQFTTKKNILSVERKFFDEACITTGTAPQTEDDPACIIRTIQIKDNPLSKFFITQLKNKPS